MTFASMSSGDFNQNPSRAKKAANEGPLVITEHGEARYVLIRYSDFKDHWRASKTLYDALNHAESQFDDDFEPPRAAFTGRDVAF